MKKDLIVLLLSTLTNLCILAQSEFGKEFSFNNIVVIDSLLEITNASKDVIVNHYKHKILLSNSYDLNITQCDSFIIIIYNIENNTTSNLVINCSKAKK